MVNSTIEKNEKKIESIALKNSNYTQNNLALDFRKISSEGFHYSCNDKKSLAQKHSLFQKQSIFGGVDEITSFPENALFFLKNTPHLMIARLIVLNLKNVFNNKKLKIVSKSFNQKVSEQEKSHHAKIFDSISFFTDKIIESFCKKFKKFNTVLCLDIKTSIQVLLLIILKYIKYFTLLLYSSL